MVPLGGNRRIAVCIILEDIAPESLRNWFGYILGQFVKKSGVCLICEWVPSGNYSLAGIEIAIGNQTGR